jgi:hypothetical protein
MQPPILTHDNMVIRIGKQNLASDGLVSLGNQ